MICEVCGGVEVYIELGVEYCKECSSQIKQSQDEVSSDESFSKRSLLSSPTVPKTVKKSKKKTFVPWTSVEAYNLILAKQVAALIENGCSEKLKTVVLHIWAKYLQQIQVAFRTDYRKNENTPLLSAFAYRRDAQLLYGDGTVSRQTKLFHRRSRKDKRRRRSSQIESSKMKSEEDSDDTRIDDSIYLNSIKEENSEMSLNHNKEKCQKFFSTLIRLAGDQTVKTASNVKKLIQNLIDNTIQPEEFSTQIQKELHSKDQPYLIHFLKQCLPFVREALINAEITIEGIHPPPPLVTMETAVTISPTASDSTISTDDLSSTEEDSEPAAPTVNQSRKNYSSYARRIKFEKRRKKKDFRTRPACCHHMDVPKTLSFCHLGLLYTEDHIQLFDLLRLVNEDKVPYIEATRHFPPTMQLQADDNRTFGQPFAPDMKAVSKRTAKLHHFLNSPKFKNPPLFPFAVRFIKDLNLPNDLIPAVKVLIDKFEAKRGEWYANKVIANNCQGVPLYEVQAMAHIIILLKMLLVLDDKFEIEHSKVMEKLNSITEDKQFFIWNDWQKQMSLKEYLFMKNGLNYTDMSRIDSLCADRILSDYPYPCLKLELVEQIKEDAKREYKAQNKIKKLLDPMFTPNISKCKATSFPLMYQLNRFVADWRNLPLYQETEHIDFSFISKDFSSHKLYYDSTSDAQESGDIAQILFSSLYELDFAHNQKFDLTKLLKTSRNYWCVRYKLSTLRSDAKEKWLADLPKSFQWLLKFACKYLQVTHFQMYLEIKDIEYKVILCR